MRARESKLLLLYLVSDLVLLNLSILLLGWVQPELIYKYDHGLTAYMLHGNLSWIVTYFILVKRNLYLRDGYFNRVKRITLRLLVFIVVALLFAYLFMHRVTYSRVFLFEYAALFYIGKLIYYFILYRYLTYLRLKGKHVKRSLIVGFNERGQILRDLMKYNVSLGYHFIGFLSDKTDGKDVLGKTDNLEKIIREQSIEMVFVNMSIYNESNEYKQYQRICDKLGVRLRYVPENQHWFHKNMNMEHVGPLVVINPQEIPLDHFDSQIIKRMFDIVFSFVVVLLILSWMIPLLGLLIKLGSKGPVFFVQERTGFNNKPFRCLKFRSMTVNKDADNLQATAGDTRISPVGRFIRKTNLDEMPQFINVLKGDMSIVGPRPHMLKHTEQYSTLIETYLIRHYIKPGITGWAQVNGYRGETDELWKMEKRVEFDMKYIRDWSFFWDLEIIYLTVFSSKALLNAR